jgi:GDP-L-fucose synthase
MAACGNYSGKRFGSSEASHNGPREREPMPQEVLNYGITRGHDMNVLVTGGTGFLGSHLVDRLRASGIEPFIARHSEYDLTTADDTRRAFSDASPDLVFHLAAEVGGIGANRARPGRFWYANLMMGAHVLEQSRLANVRKLVMVGTICAYPKFTPVPFREEDLWNGYPEETNAPYGVAKRALLVGAHAYRDQYELDVIHLLPVNLYGPRDDFDLETSHVIPALIRKMTDAKEREASEVTLWGDGSPTREFLYVDDCAEGLLLAAERYDGPDPVNLGTGEEISIRDLAHLVAEVTGYDGEIVWDTSQPGGQPRRCLDVSRAERLFGFRARTAFRDGLERTVSWYLDTTKHAAPSVAR